VNVISNLVTRRLVGVSVLVPEIVATIRPVSVSFLLIVSPRPISGGWSRRSTAVPVDNHCREECASKSQILRLAKVSPQKV
jgi:hypothetical protein